MYVFVYYQTNCVFGHATWDHKHGDVGGELGPAKGGNVGRPTRKGTRKNDATTSTILYLHELSEEVQVELDY